ncbi:spermidine synthase [Saccharopolyspora erythraea]|uniref:spermidine synthase n=1 Tax=Saccharopolyspora erythraea TaxID=1836 RepID=UPI001E5FE1B6|nr:spermidine synthase [Saccharopolyspora erythraea]
MINAASALLALGPPAPGRASAPGCSASGTMWDGRDQLGVRFEEIDWRETPIGVISLRRRRDPLLEVDVYEVKLDDEYLMSSLFTVAEVELARLGLAELPGTGFDVVVGGLGLGHSARSVLEDSRVRSLIIVEGLGEVIEWHQRELLPLSPSLARDARNRFVHGDFFAMAGSTAGFDPVEPGRRFHVILVDIDHSPRHVLDPSHAGFYTTEGLRRLGSHLHPGGVFALWSDDPPDEEFNSALAEVFTTSQAHVVTFPNPYSGGVSANTVYVATT